MDLHCGTISATSAGVGRGCIFTVELPVVQRIRDPTIHCDSFSELRPREPDRVQSAPVKPINAIADPMSHHDVPDIENTAPMKSLRTVLVVDDSGPTRKMICRMLKNFGCRHFEAEDGTDCVSVYSKSVEEGGPTFDLVLMDFVMPSKFLP